jgi:signal transduction histidine kinase
MVRGRILVVDDEVDHLNLLRVILRREFDVLTASSGAAALDIVRDAPPDLVIADQRMPDMSGLELLAWLRDHHPTIVRILLTAYSDAAVLKDAINAAGVYRFVTKPWDPELLRMDLRRALEHRESMLQLQRAQKVAVLGGLAGAVAHDLQGVLSPFAIAPHLLRERKASPEEVADLLERASDAAHGLTQELLSLARGEQPKLRLRPARLVEVVKGGLSLCQGSAVDEVTVDLELADALPSLDLAADRCSRLVINLVRNAAEAAGPGGRIQVTVDAVPGGQRVVVEDDGPGVPEPLQDRIFDPFFSTKGSAGHGLGLASCRAIVAGHGGTLLCETSPLGGARFVAVFVAAS